MKEKITAWIARDKNPYRLGLFFGNPPVKGEATWLLNGSNRWIPFYNNLFHQVKLEDEEPTKVELTIKICE